MSRILAIFIIPFLLIGLTSCTTVPKEVHYIDSETKKNIRTSDAILLKVQKELNTDDYATFSPPGGGDGGVLGFITKKHLIKEAEKDVMPVRNVLADFNVEKELQREVLSVLKKASWLKIEKINIIENDLNNEVHKFVEESNASVVIIMTPVYLLLNNFTTLTMALKLDVYSASVTLPHVIKKESKQGRTPKPIYSVTVRYNKVLENRNFRPTLNARQWSENKGEKIKQALREGITQLVKDIERETQNPTDN